MIGRDQCPIRFGQAARRVAVVLTMLAAPCAGASVRAGAADSSPATGTEKNTATLVVKTPVSGFNRMTLDVELCHPGTDNCQTIHDVMVDTGSTGLRIQARAIHGLGLDLPPARGADKRFLAECQAFVGHNNIWGSIKKADMRIGGMVARDMPIQIANDEEFPRPDNCPNYHNKPTSNGTLGIGWRPFDPNKLLSCTTDGCTAVTEPGGLEHLPNPVSSFARHNNGEIFLFGDAENNKIDGVPQLPLDANGYFTTRYDNKDYTKSYIDSGTQTVTFKTDSLGLCPNGFDYCQAVVDDLPLGLRQSGSPDVAVSTSFRISPFPGPPSGRLHGVYGDIAIPAKKPNLFVLGLPFFLGKRVALRQETLDPATGAVAAAPYYAIEPTAPSP